MVSLKMAWYWKCPLCGADNTEHGDKITRREAKDLAKHLELSPVDGALYEEIGECVTMPKNVTCRSCDATQVVDTSEWEVVDGPDKD